MARQAPAPTQTPSMAATMGCGQARMALTTAPVMRVNFKRSGISILVNGSMISNTSPPAQKFPSAPGQHHSLDVRIMTAAPRKCRAVRRRISKVSGFFLSGRSRSSAPPALEPASGSAPPDSPQVAIVSASFLAPGHRRTVSFSVPRCAISCFLLVHHRGRRDLADPFLMGLRHGLEKSPGPFR